MPPTPKVKIGIGLTNVRTYENKWPLPVLTGIDMAMTAMITDKEGHVAYAQTSLQTFILECGRTERYIMTLRATGTPGGLYRCRHINTKYSPVQPNKRTCGNGRQ